MTELLCDLNNPTQHIDHLYFKELQLKFNSLFESFKKGATSAYEIETSLKRELSFIIDLSKKMALEKDELTKLNKTPLPLILQNDHPADEITPLSYFEYLALNSTAEDLVYHLPKKIKNKDAYWKRVVLSFRINILKKYEWFLQEILGETFEITQSPEYWKMRGSHIGDNAAMNDIDSTPNEQTQETQKLLIPDSIEHLIKKDMIIIKGGKYCAMKGLRNSLNEIAKAWVDFTKQKINPDYLLTNIMKHNKKPYEYSSCVTASKIANRILK